jgi:hypothetical protein
VAAETSGAVTLAVAETSGAVEAISAEAAISNSAAEIRLRLSARRRRGSMQILYVGLG